MLIRIVKMGFHPEHINTFLNTFDTYKSEIRSFPGCEFLQLHQDKEDPAQFFTYSYWQDEAALEKYRNSELFKKVWRQTKQWFCKKPEAWSVDNLISLP